MYGVYFFVFKHKTAYEMRISDWSSDVCSSDLSAAFLDVLASPTLGSRYSVARPVRPFSQEIGTDPGRLRIGLLRASPLRTPLHEDCKAAVDLAGKLCMDLGHTVEEVSPEIGRASCRERGVQYV